MKKFIPAFLIATALTTSAFTAESNPSFGIVNFGTCVSDSKLGKQEQASFESLKKQMTTLLEDTEKQLNELSAKFNDPEYLDGLSPEAEDELKNKFRSLSEEMNRYQNQYYQVMNQANMRIMQVMANNINIASEKVAKDKKLAMVVNKDACFFYSPALDITPTIIAEMDKTFSEQEAKKETAAAEKPANAPVAKAEDKPAAATEQKTEAKK